MPTPKESLTRSNINQISALGTATVFLDVRSVASCRKIKRESARSEGPYFAVYKFENGKEPELLHVARDTETLSDAMKPSWEVRYNRWNKVMNTRADFITKILKTIITSVIEPFLKK